jgi:hypothetical protein
MDFEQWLTESTLPELYHNSVIGFPETTKRQHATSTIKITHLNWVPYLGMKTLFVKGLAQNEGREHNPIIIFKGVQYREQTGKNIIPLIINSGQKYLLDQLSFEKNEVLVRCDCKDHQWRFCHTNAVDRSLYGRDRKKYEAKYRPGSANPKKLPGLCKHLMVLGKVLKESGIIQ